MQYTRWLSFIQSTVVVKPFYPISVTPKEYYKEHRQIVCSTYLSHTNISCSMWNSWEVLITFIFASPGPRDLHNQGLTISTNWCLLSYSYYNWMFGCQWDTLAYIISVFRGQIEVSLLRTNLAIIYTCKIFYYFAWTCRHKRMFTYSLCLLQVDSLRIFSGQQKGFVHFVSLNLVF